VCDPVVVETVVIDGRCYRVSWLDPPFVPPPRETTQALGICFTGEGEIVLVTLDGNAWSLPGGTIEPGETLEQALVREVREEACARVRQSRYIGCQHVEELDGHRASYYQTRFWARVELEPFTPRHETTGRILVAPDGFLETLSWGRETTASLILQRGAAIEREPPPAGGET
jgi:ADP-ribose pyrophosphatase YjhB (NUDIX family)